VQIVRICIVTESPLVDTLSDFLIGIMGAAVEYGVDGEGPGRLIQGFIVTELLSENERDSLVDQARVFAAEMADIFQLPIPTVEGQLIEDQDWSTKWKEYFRPFAIIPGLVIAPSWEPQVKNEQTEVIVMDPGMAFGTGHHATTRLCLELMKTVAPPVEGGRVLDVGTGTGILGMAAAFWGWSDVEGIDTDLQAVAVAEENIIRNNLQKTMHVSGQLLSAIEGLYQLVIANIVHDVLIDLAGDLERVTDRGGMLILSGLIDGEQTESIITCFKEKSFLLTEQRQSGEWGAIRFVKERKR